MSKDVRRLFAAQKAAKAGSSGSGSGPGSGSSSLSSSKRVTHPLAKYDPKTLRLTCAICGPTVPIKSDNLWNAHLVSKAHQEAVTKLRAVKEQMQKREAETAERARLQQEQQQQKTSTQAQGVKRKAPGGLVAYAEDSESESDDDNGGDNQMEKALSNKHQPMSESKRVKLENEMMDLDEEERQRRQAVADIEEEEHAMAGLPAGFFDSGVVPSNDQEDDTQEAPSSTEESTAVMDGVLPAGFFDDPEMEARVRAEVGGATTDQLERQVEEELKALQAELAQDLEDEVEDRGQTTVGPSNTANGSQVKSIPNSEYIPYEEKMEQEEQELEESMLARMEEEYQLFVEMQTRVDSLREKKNRLLAPHSSSGPSLTSDSPSSVVPPTPTLSDPKSQPGKQKKKSILELVREQERAKKEKERLAAEEYNRVRAATVENDSKMAGSDDESEEEEDDEEDIEAMMDWRAKRF
ncbi:hypothetical protein BGX34_000924 [Mortierella sp. NVP85]|nr:hypothetical protein BGX34_000924 [Mortierella sp. NVP85]